MRSAGISARRRSSTVTVMTWLGSIGVAAGVAVGSSERSLPDSGTSSGMRVLPGELVLPYRDCVAFKAKTRSVRQLQFFILFLFPRGVGYCEPACAQRN